MYHFFLHLLYKLLYDIHFFFASDVYIYNDNKRLLILIYYSNLQLGIGHITPGYPLFTLQTHTITVVPLTLSVTCWYHKIQDKQSLLFFWHLNFKI